VTKLSALPSSNYGRVSRWLLLVVLILFLLIGGKVVNQSLDSFAKLKNGQIDLSASQAQKALIIIKPLNLITGHRISFLAAWQAGLDLETLLPDWIKYLSYAQTSQNQAEDAVLSAKLISQTCADIDQLSLYLPRIFWAQKLIPKPVLAVFDYWQNHQAELRSLISYYLNNNHTILLIFQNSHELRASGGFMGSYALLKTKSGQIESWVVEDIYDADGQFTGFVTAPHGVKEYLSSAKGMRLPDSNWQAEFSQAAPTILQYFALGDRSNIDTVITINHSVLEDLLKVTGPIYLPDYHQVITSETAINLLENRPGNFFAGSGLKKHLISQLITQIKLLFEDFGTEEWTTFFELMPKFISHKDIQIYSIQPDIQAHLEQLGVTGTWPWPKDADLVGWIESNVGINKVNKYVTRTLEITLSQYQTQITAQFHNADSLQYVNYQRVYVPNQWQIVSVVDQNREIVDWHQELVELTDGQVVREIGFLVITPGQSQQTVSLLFDRRNDPKTSGKEIFMPKQSGLPPLPVTLIRDDLSQTVMLESDQVF